MKEKNTSEILSEFLSVMNNAKSQYDLYKSEMENQEKITQDYLHSLEIDNLKCAERSKIATQLVINRKDRRYYKDKVEELEPIVDFLNDPVNKKAIDKLTQILGKVRKAETYHETRKYKPKVITK